MGAVFLFFILFTILMDTLHLGNSFSQHLDIIQYSSMDIEQFISEIVKLRADTLPWELKELNLDEIRSRIHEFFLITMDEKSVWCFRIFEPVSMPGYLELWSVKSDVRWCGRLIVDYSVALATETQQNIVAITGERYEKTLKQSGWVDATAYFPERMAESHEDKKLWLYPKL